MTLPITAGTRLVALLGNPVSHSLSPAFQNAAFRAAGVDGVYLALRCGEAELAGLINGIARAGGAGNITVPHKEAAAHTVQRPTEAVRRTNACNTFWLRDGEVWGDNTDVVGFRRAVAELLGHAAAGARVLLIGAGGAARAALCGLADDGADEVIVFNRSAERAVQLADRFQNLRTRIHVAPALETLRSESFDLIVNATSLGLRADDPLPTDPGSPPRATAALDLVYSPRETAWVRALRDHGIPAADGLDMLLYQGAAAFERWWNAPAPIAAMRAALPAR